MFTRMEKTVFFALAALELAAIAVGCSTTVNNYGDNARFELSPARDVARHLNAEVMNGLSMGIDPNAVGDMLSGDSSAVGKTDSGILSGIEAAL